MGESLQTIIHSDSTPKEVDNILKTLGFELIEYGFGEFVRRKGNVVVMVRLPAYGVDKGFSDTSLSRIHYEERQFMDAEDGILSNVSLLQIKKKYEPFYQDRLDNVPPHKFGRYYHLIFDSLESPVDVGCVLFDDEKSDEENKNEMDIIKIVQAAVSEYAGKRDYGCPRFLGTKDKEKMHISYEDVTGSTHYISFILDLNQGTYNVKDFRHKYEPTAYLQEALQQLHGIIMGIAVTRTERMISFFQDRQNQGKTLEDTLNFLERLAEQPFGPAQEELAGFRKECERLYNQHPC